MNHENLLIFTNLSTKPQYLPSKAAAMVSSTPLKSNVLLVLFPGFNTLDMNGPYEVLQRSADASVFTITVASETDITTSVEGVQVKVSSPVSGPSDRALTHSP